MPMMEGSFGCEVLALSSQSCLIFILLTDLHKISYNKGPRHLVFFWHIVVFRLQNFSKLSEMQRQNFSTARVILENDAKTSKETSDSDVIIVCFWCS